MALPTNPHGGAGNKGLPNSPSNAGNSQSPQNPSGPRSNNPRPRVSNNDEVKTRTTKNSESGNESRENRSNVNRSARTSDQRESTQRKQQQSSTAPKRRPMSIKEKLAQSNAQKVSRNNVIDKDGVRQSEGRRTVENRAPVKDAAKSASQDAKKVQARNAQNEEQNGNGNNVHDGYAVDPVTGKMYKKLPQNDKDLVKQYNRSNGKMEISIEQMRQTAESVDIDLHNMEKSADEFLAHLRVPPDKDEIERLKQERIRLANKQSKEFEDEQNFLLDKLGSLDPDPDEVWDPDKI